MMLSAIDLASYHEDRDLGGDLSVRLVVKSRTGATLASARLAEQAENEASGQPYAPHRLPGYPPGGGLIVRATLAEIREGAGTLQSFPDEQPYSLVDLPEGELVACSRRLVLRVGEVEVWSRTSSDFRQLHTVQVAGPRTVLLSDPGQNRLIELDYHTGDLVWEWDPVTAGLDRNLLGLRIGQAGRPLPSGAALWDESTADLWMSAGRRAPDHAIHLLDRAAVQDPRGLRSWQVTAGPNSAIIHPEDQDFILATLFTRNEVVAIHRPTGKVTVLARGLARPHGVEVVDGGWLVADSMAGRALVFDPLFRLRDVYSVARLPVPDPASRRHEWLQACVAMGGLMVAADSRRHSILVWCPRRRLRATYTHEPEWRVHAIFGPRSIP